MTTLELFAVFGVPLLLLILGGGVALWVRYGSDERHQPSKPGRAN